MGRGSCRALVSMCAGALTIIVSMLAAGQANADDGDLGGALLNQINATRAANGCGPVADNPQLTAAAARHANDALASGAAGHTGSDGSSVAQRVADAGYAPYSRIGEVVYWGTGALGSPAAAVMWWMNSPDHRAIITDCGFTDAGFSAVSNGDKLTATADFARS